MSKQCRECGANIIWKTTTNGKNVPVDAVPSKRFVDVIDGGKDRVSYKDTYTNHFGTCLERSEGHVDYESNGTGLSTICIQTRHTTGGKARRIYQVLSGGSVIAIYEDNDDLEQCINNKEHRDAYNGTVIEVTVGAYNNLIAEYMAGAITS